MEEMMGEALIMINTVLLENIGDDVMGVKHTQHQPVIPERPSGSVDKLEVGRPIEDSYT